jgi:hypothetical protein
MPQDFNLPVTNSKPYALYRSDDVSYCFYVVFDLYPLNNRATFKARIELL